ncbi:3-dehydroquinate dehydratase [Lachnotalea glycerini]|uniref:3-dehydroquinate dehydratase n=1 Tax=Lachnotalea glycerini TaxID=1763509 RepID=A0A255IJU1_9FIRM|nr:type I 3-dehydroquinate dehydratase [Lachnotalea glycerini]PXV89433.1 3-dehydroquinate dehydratase [Lachnotalea glycerini]RDY32378.1 type I 3-dehydroquinate dehydratase [Lachnotalea glycerini]
MNTVTVKNVVIGEGLPKICVPIVSKTRVEIIEEAKSITDIPVDIVEWRVDWFEGSNDLKQIIAVLEDLAPALNEIPLLFTFRTKREGGEKAIEAASYAALNQAVAATGLVDLVDIEIFTGDEIVKSAIEHIHASKVKVIASNHDFDKTPSKEDIVERLRKMQDLGADIAKIAVMPNNKLDVLELMAATVIMSEQYARIPIVTMSMSGIGVVSRLTGEAFGSAITFGSAKKASAPGQIPVKELDHVLQLLNRSMH